MPGWNDPITWGQYVYAPLIILGCAGVVAGSMWLFFKLRRKR